MNKISANRDREDSYYFNRTEHTSKRVVERSSEIRNVHELTPEIITKWSLNTKVFFSDGDLKRGADLFQKEKIIMDVFSKGITYLTILFY